MSVQKIEPVNGVTQVSQARKMDNLSLNAPQKSFMDVLSHAVDTSERLQMQQDALKLQFSKHASLRILSRDINLTSDQLKRIEEGVTKARNKGIDDSLVLVDDYALVVNTRSRTVITAMESRQKSDGVFTNIDGAVIV